MFELGGASQPDKATQCQLHLKLQAAMSHQVAKRQKIAALDAALTNIFSNLSHYYYLLFLLQRPIGRYLHIHI